MAAAPQSSASGDSGKRQALIGVNDLNYVLPPDLSVSVVRTHTNHYFQQAEYAHTSRAICILNTGAHYIDTRQSSLEFGVQITANNNAIHAFLGANGSALNLIESITVSSRAGDELARINQADLLHYHTTPWKHDTNYIETVAQGYGYGGQILNPNDDTRGAQFSIPLCDLCDFFAYGRLLPSMLASGLRISIAFTTPANAFSFRRKGNAPRTAGDNITAYTITNPYISTFAHQLSDGVQRDLNELSATNGLEIVYCDWEATEQSYGTATNTTVQLEVRKAASRALQAIAITRLTGDINNIEQHSYDSKEFDHRRWQWQLGSLYFPQQPVVAGTAGLDSNRQTKNALAESYKHTLISYGTYGKDHTKHSAVPFRSHRSYLDKLTNATGDEWVRNNDINAADTPWEAADLATIGFRTSLAGSHGTYSHMHSSIGVTLERTDLFNLSGVPINNARVLSFRTEYESNAAEARTLTIFLKYVRLARCFLNNVEVEQ